MNEYGFDRLLDELRVALNEKTIENSIFETHFFIGQPGG